MNDELRKLAAELYDDLYDFRDVHTRYQQIEMILKSFDDAYTIKRDHALDGRNYEE